MLSRQFQGLYLKMCGQDMVLADESANCNKLAVLPGFVCYRHNLNCQGKPFGIPRYQLLQEKWIDSNTTCGV